MKERDQPKPQESGTEKISRFGRNINAAQAGGFEVLRRQAQKSRTKKPIG